MFFKTLKDSEFKSTLFKVTHIFKKCSLGKVMSRKSQLISLPGEVMRPLIKALRIEPRESRFYRRTIETTDNV